MYCKICGCKIKSGMKRCPDCGADVSDIEYCGGFWGLVGEDTEVKMPVSFDTGIRTGESADEREKEQEYKSPSYTYPENEEKSQANRRKEPDVLGQGTKQNKSSNLLTKILAVAATLLLLFCIVQTFRLSGAEKKNKEAMAECESLKEEVKSLNSKNTKLESQVKKLSDIREEEILELLFQREFLRQELMMDDLSDKEAARADEKEESSDEKAATVDEEEESSKTEITPPFSNTESDRQTKRYIPGDDSWKDLPE